MLATKVKELLQTAKPLLVLALCTREEVTQLKNVGLPIVSEVTYLSMQNLYYTQVLAERTHGQKQLAVLAVTPDEKNMTEVERALIYALFLRCRKVISCRDKLEDMLKYDDREGWYTYKAAYEQQVLDLYKKTWNDAVIYPYNIVDNIKAYNKDESYILKELHDHLSERTPGRINAGDLAMINKLRQMFSDISVALMQPDVVLVGNIQGDAKLSALAAKYELEKNIEVIAL